MLSGYGKGVTNSGCIHERGNVRANMQIRIYYTDNKGTCTETAVAAHISGRTDQASHIVNYS